MQRLNEFFHSFTAPADNAREIDAIYEAMSAVEAAIPIPDISRARAEHALHRLTADIVVTKRSGHMSH